MCIGLAQQKDSGAKKERRGRRTEEKEGKRVSAKRGAWRIAAAQNPLVICITFLIICFCALTILFIYPFPSRAFSFSLCFYHSSTLCTISFFLVNLESSKNLASGDAKQLLGRCCPFVVRVND